MCYAESSFNCSKLCSFSVHFDRRCKMHIFIFIISTIVAEFHSFILNFRLMFDPYAKLVYDYMGGVNDIWKAKVCMYL